MKEFYLMASPLIVIVFITWFLTTLIFWFGLSPEKSLTDVLIIERDLIKEVINHFKGLRI
jgi:hypothetical protein